MNVTKPVIAVFIVLALSLIGMNVALVKQDRRLAGLNKAYEMNLHLNVGTMVPSLSGTSLMGRPQQVAYKPGRPKTLLLVFARSCPDCTLNWPAWQKVLSRVDPNRVRLIGVSLENEGLTSQFLTQVGINKAEIILLPDAGSIISYRFRYTPQTILIGSDSKVEGIWSGVLNAQQIREVETDSLSPEARHLATADRAAQPP